ncbi:hypothetical protein DEU56DRAFT_828357 [Suillus clintonianus]|uniref:uncharacterized protein n=1 Tax=Suillus clintonianus TaxID=1904413 RepID=UPI001B87A7EA|nr:uncharacterized protein DEU56DRAFT_828357 [Suillus clintonianus]KAG2124038.1 hypothetical protein DEU56DRAFT_828357 [Suillus clintonianus]
MSCNHDNVALGTEDQLISLRHQINEIQEHIDLLMMQSAIIRERRSLLQQQPDVKPLAITEQQDHPCPETSHVNFLDMEDTLNSVVSGPSLALKGAGGIRASPPRSGSTMTTLSDATTIVHTPAKPQGSTSQVRAKPRRCKPGRREFHGRSARHEPPALFQGWVDVSGSIF